MKSKAALSWTCSTSTPGLSLGQLHRFSATRRVSATPLLLGCALPLRSQLGCYVCGLYLTLCVYPLSLFHNTDFSRGLPNTLFNLLFLGLSVFPLSLLVIRLLRSLVRHFTPIPYVLIASCSQFFNYRSLGFSHSSLLKNKAFFPTYKGKKNEILQMFLK